MKKLSKEEFTELANYHSDLCISIYIPTHSSGVEVNEKYDLVVFKNNVQKAKLAMQEKDLDGREIDSILKPAMDLIKDDDFWNKQLQGLAVFLSKGFQRIYQLPVTVKEKLLVNSTFLVAPLLPIMPRRHPFYLLVLSKHDAKFYEGDQFQMKELEIEGLPNGMDDVIHYEEKGGKQLLRKGGTSPGGEASYHGHGTGLADDNEYINKYLKEVDQTLWTELLGRQQYPLVIAAVDYMAAMYKQVSHYKYICDEVLTGNYEHENANSLFPKVKEKLAPYFKEYVNAALKNFYDNSTTGLSSSTPEEVISAAHYSQVSDLFVEKDQHIWGSFDEQDNKIVIHKEKQEGDECLINKAIIKTIMNGGEVHWLDKEKMPTGSPVAAFLRFPL